MQQSMMDDIKNRNLTVRLSRLTQQEASSYGSTSPPSKPSSKPVGRPPKRQIDLSRISPAHRPSPQKKKKRNRADGFKVSSTSTSHVKIKLNFFKKRAARTVVDTETTEENGGYFKEEREEPKLSSGTVIVTPSTSNTSLLSSTKSLISSTGTKHEDQASNKNSESTSSEAEDNDDRDDSSWADEYEYRPRRAAAAAALEAVKGKRKGRRHTSAIDLDMNKLRLRSKFAINRPVPKGRSRRTVWKRAAAQRARIFRQRPRVYTCMSLIYKDVYYQRGDIVSVLGEDDETYYCQIAGLLVDQMTRNFASLSWLVPKRNSPPEPFQPHNYSIRDDLLPSMTPLDDLEFVMHCPHDYFYDYQINFMKWNPEGGTVYQRLGQPFVTVEDAPSFKQVIIDSDEDEREPENGSDLKIS